jgi:hypothetical protein
MSKIKRKCDFCPKEYEADLRDVNRGWALCCSKSCAAKKRESLKSKDSENTGEIVFTHLWSSHYGWEPTTCFPGQFSKVEFRGDSIPDEKIFIANNGLLISTFKGYFKKPI